MKTHLQPRSCWRKAQRGPVKPACGITASLQSACYNLPGACPAPAPHSRATQPVLLQAHTSTPTHRGQCSFWPNRERSEEQSLSFLAMFPLFFCPAYQKWMIWKDSASVPRIKEAGQQRSPWKQWDETKKNKEI